MNSVQRNGLFASFLSQWFLPRAQPLLAVCVAFRVISQVTAQCACLACPARLLLSAGGKRFWEGGSGAPRGTDLDTWAGEGLSSGHCSHWSWGDVAFFPAAGSELGCVPRVEQVPLSPGSHLSLRSQLPRAGPYERGFSGFVWLPRLLASVYPFSWKEPLSRVMTTADLGTAVFSCVAWPQAAPNLVSP